MKFDFDLKDQTLDRENENPPSGRSLDEIIVEKAANLLSDELLKYVSTQESPIPIPTLLSMTLLGEQKKVPALLQIFLEVLSRKKISKRTCVLLQSITKRGATCSSSSLCC